MDGLRGLASIPQDLAIGTACGKMGTHYCGNAALTALDGLGGLASVGGSLSISGNEALTDLAGLGALASVGGDLSINENAALTSVGGLDGLTSVGGDLAIGMHLETHILPVWTCSGNVALANLDGLARLRSVGEELAIGCNTVLPTCEATALADRLVSLGWEGTATIEGNDAGVCE